MTGVPGVGRGQRVDDRGQNFVVDVDKVDGVLSGVDVVGQHYGDRLTGVAGLVDGQSRMPGRMHLVGVGGLAGRQLSDVRDVMCGDDRLDPRQGESGGGVDAPDAGVAVGAANDEGIKHTGPGHVIHEGGLAG